MHRILTLSGVDKNESTYTNNSTGRVTKGLCTKVRELETCSIRGSLIHSAVFELVIARLSNKGRGYAIMRYNY